MTIKVRIREADLMPRIVQLSCPALTIGRSSDCDIRLTNQSISRHHARIDFSPPSGYVLSDEGSRAGTMLNDHPVQKPMLLKQGDEIGIGEARIVVLELDHQSKGNNQDHHQDKGISVGKSPAEPKKPHESVVVLPPSAIEPHKTQLSSSIQEKFQQPRQWDQAYDQAVELLRGDFETFWKAVKARTPYELAGQMQALKDAVDGGITRLAGVAEGVKESHEHLEKLLEASRVISAPLPLRRRLETILDMVIEKLEGDCGFLMLYSQRTKSLKLALHRGMSEVNRDLDVSGDLSPPRNAGEMMAQETFKAGITQMRLGQKEIQSGLFTQALASQGIHCAICSPMRVKSRFLGLIYVDFRDPKKAAKPVGPKDAEWLDGLSSLSALAIENARLIERQKTGK